MPAFLLLVLIEKFYGYYRGNDTVRNMDMISSLSSGFTNVIKDVLGISVAIIGYSWMVEHLAIVHIKANWLVYLVAFLALDFSGYWVHRIAHEYNFFWNNHIVHHSSEEFNLACALRQSISVFVRIFTFFLLPAALLGVPGQVIAIVAPIQLFAQFWYHTRHIGHMGFFRKDHSHSISSSGAPCDQSAIPRQKLFSNLYLVGSVVWHLPTRAAGSTSGIWYHPTCTNLEPSQN